MVLECNWGAVRANDKAHQRRLEEANRHILEKLNRIIELLEPKQPRKGYHDVEEFYRD